MRLAIMIICVLLLLVSFAIWTRPTITTTTTLGSVMTLRLDAIGAW